MFQKLLSVALVLMVIGFAPRALAQSGSISMSSTGYPDSVVIDVTVQDPGGYPGGNPTCQWLAVTRGSDVIAFFPRQMGTTSMHHVVDTNVQSSTLYCYRMALITVPAPVPLFCNGDVWSLCQVFDCFYDIQTCANTGPNPAFLGHGLLKTTFPDGSPVDGNEVTALLYACGTQNFIAIHTVSGTASQYVDSNTEVTVFGTWVCCWAQGVWLLEAQAATPEGCTIATEPKTWGAVKSLYRN